MNEDTKGAKVRVPPPLIFILCIALAWAVDRYLPWHFVSPLWLKVASIALILVGFWVLLQLLVLFKRQQTAIEPWKPTTFIITNGYYRYSRNPIYLAFCCFPIGLGFYIGSIWLLLSTLPALFGVYWFAIRAEEEYLLAKFPDDYGDYIRRVRRWL
ncbi:protein-S-isoprenylcysteine methyltransferase [Shewanella colwelliana]|uniref:Protein-S-isoprenylcysteine methyltransferase n=1 Tax=Shewanella colwelliana TaxID=23 RepID=A0A1E5ISZ5_SHECO|nr:isoprenylcysteine carboxylmethyltransferase family protein [Shewanella colwelliana]MDX1281985.1 isoprenylcysteine carboxylmethyltransferase family protein [Shewanella colwelliana]OEG73557.1 hypothetical protein BEL05_18440 [Shewanella colwelliana]GIU27259.1 protein-S-isoprenylcysteine methyltransferase [Shewanella colwelliana]GIU40443.1 protein-S-isoprenylcysteine methyltransferase [Shewanella colwelliana]